MDEKRCSKCKLVKPIKEFHKTKRVYNGRIYEYTHAKCKECRNEEKRNYHIKNKARDNKRAAEYYAKNLKIFRKKYRRIIDD